jgi:hypothetical protein
MLAYLFYRGPWSVVVIDTVCGDVGMITQFAFLDLAAKFGPRRVEATFFARLMSVFNDGNQSSYLYDWLGYLALALISAAKSFTGAPSISGPEPRAPRHARRPGDPPPSSSSAIWVRSAPSPPWAVPSSTPRWPRGVSLKRLINVSISALAWERVAPRIPHVRDSAPHRATYSSNLSPGIGPD